uniref:Uncharacterized protein n=1 Tax=Anguilla anguilla TaxID=7936 RepID=A0A0E9U6B0_ANGAN
MAELMKFNTSTLCAGIENNVIRYDVIQCMN